MALSLKAALVNKGLTQTELARQIHKSRSYVSLLINRRRPMPPDVAELIALKAELPLEIVQGHKNGAGA